jgi:hypothetical protein
MPKMRKPRESHAPYQRKKKPGPKPKNGPRTTAQDVDEKEFTVLTNHDWITVFHFMDAHPDMSQSSVAKHFSSKKEGRLCFTQATLSRRYAKRTQIEDQVAQYANGASAKRQRVVTAPEVEQALILWVRHMESKDETVSGKMLIEKRKIFEDRLGIPEERRLDGPGWVHSFCKAYGLKEIRRHGEAASVDLEKVEAEVSRLKKITASYDRKDILNVDESGLFALWVPCFSRV